MPDDKTVKASETGRERLSSRLKRAGLAFLFSAVLLIPRVRRLRRRTRVWTLIRVVAAIAAAWLIWQFVRGTAGIPSLLFAIGLALLSVLVKARPERKSVDDLAREINALVVLNGGSWIDPEQSKPVPETSIFVNPDRLVVFTAKLQQVTEILLSGVRQVCTRAVPSPAFKDGDPAAEVWEMEIRWHSNGRTHVATFRFHSFFAEHLARVAEQTITSVWKKQLPVLRS
jgi:hypothetical protein